MAKADIQQQDYEFEFVVGQQVILYPIRAAAEHGFNPSPPRFDRVVTVHDDGTVNLARGGKNYVEDVTPFEPHVCATCGVDHHFDGKRVW